MRTIGVATPDGELLAAVGYCNWRQVDIEMWVAAEPGTRWLTRGNLRAFFSYPFVDLGCRRATAICEKRNRRARRFVEHLGWTLEGTHPGAALDGGAMCSYGMLREHCRWIDHDRGIDHGQVGRLAASAA